MFIKKIIPVFNGRHFISGPLFSLLIIVSHILFNNQVNVIDHIKGYRDSMTMRTKK